MSFVQKFADSAKNIGSKAKGLGDMAGEKARDITKKSSELLEYTKLKNELRKMEKEMENNLAGIGALYYQQLAGVSDVEQELSRLVGATKGLEEQMKELEQQISSMQPEPPACEDCNKTLPEGGKYCSYCGQKIVEA